MATQRIETPFSRMLISWLPLPLYIFFNLHAIHPTKVTRDVVPGLVVSLQCWWALPF